MDRDWTGEDEVCLRLNIPSSSSSSMSHASLVLRANSWNDDAFLDLVLTMLAFGVSLNLKKTCKTNNLKTDVLHTKTQAGSQFEGCILWRFIISEKKNETV